jgi:signal transduction histidine kinase
MPDPKEIELKELIFGGVFIMLLLATAIVVFFVVYQKRLLAQQLRLQQIQNDYQLQLLTSSIDAQEKERVRIGHDLHDEIGSSLSAIKMMVNQIQWHDDESSHIVLGMKHVLTNTIQDVRNISMNLYPSVLAKFGLVDALQNLATVLSNASNLSVDLATDESFDLPYEKQLAIYRIVQELSNNALKHAQATELNIELKQTNGQLLLVVKDNGCGYDPSAFKAIKQSGIGLKSIEARTAILQANMQIISSKNLGTQIEINIPLNGI